jgi:hypothetical protein
VTVTGVGGAGIGSGVGNATVGAVFVGECQVGAASDTGAAVGARAVEVSGGRFELAGRVGIGAVGEMRIGEAPITFACTADPCLSAVDATVDAESLTAEVAGSRLFSDGFAGDGFAPGFLYAEYAPPSQKENTGNLSAIQIASAEVGRTTGNVTLEFRAGGEVRRTVVLRMDAVTGFMISVPTEGTYTVADSKDSEKLCFDDQQTLVVDDGLAFVELLAVCPPPVNVWTIIGVALGVVGGIVLIYTAVICFLRFRRSGRYTGPYRSTSGAPLLARSAILESEGTPWEKGKVPDDTE